VFLAGHFRIKIIAYRVDNDLIAAFAFATLGLIKTVFYLLIHP